LPAKSVIIHSSIYSCFISAFISSTSTSFQGKIATEAARTSRYSEK